MKKVQSVETRNVTLALPRALLRKVKLLAVERDTSISGLLTNFLEEIVERHDDYERARRKAIRDLRRPPDLATGGRASWKRDDLHGQNYGGVIARNPFREASALPPN